MNLYLFPLQLPPVIEICQSGFGNCLLLLFFVGLKWILIFVFLLAVIFVIWGGFKLVLSPNQQDQESAKKIVLFSFLGLIVALLSLTLVRGIEKTIFPISEIYQAFQEPEVSFPSLTEPESVPIEEETVPEIQPQIPEFTPVLPSEDLKVSICTYSSDGTFDLNFTLYGSYDFYPSKIKEFPAKIEKMVLYLKNPKNSESKKFSQSGVTCEFFPPPKEPLPYQSNLAGYTCYFRVNEAQGKKFSSENDKLEIKLRKNLDQLHQNEDKFKGILNIKISFKGKDYWTKAMDVECQQKAN